MIKFLIHFHRILGTLFSILLLVWFLSGFVMIYKHFPTLGTKEYAHLTSLPDSLPDIGILQQVIPEDEAIRSIAIQMFREEPVFKVKTSKKSYLLSADTLLMPLSEGVPFVETEAYARRWNKATIRKVDTLYTLDQWIPYSQYKSDFPIYKFHFDDKENSFLYISSVTGNALQYLTLEQRIWSWLGPIPHMLYFWQWRQHRPEWVTLITWLTGIGALMCLAGIILGIWSYLITYRKKKKLQTPYRKFYFKWHHILGFLFGFFVFMFILSGMMAFNDLPQWVVKTEDNSIVQKLNKSHPINLSLFEADYRLILQQNRGKVKQISYEQFGNKPYYSVIYDGKMHNIDASDRRINPLYLTETDVLDKISQVSNAPKTISLMTEFDNYYVGFTKRMELPVYKVITDDIDKSVFYVNPYTGRTRYFNTNQRVKKWIYPAFHSLRFKFFAERRQLRDTVLWMLMIGGTLVSFTGVVLGVRYLARILQRKRKKDIGRTKSQFKSRKSPI